MFWSNEDIWVTKEPSKRILLVLSVEIYSEQYFTRDFC